MNINFNIYAIIVLILSAIVGFGGGFIANIISKDESKITKLKIAFKAVALLGMIAALLISIYL
jgi:uncharacterized membrane protein YeiH